MAIASPVSTPEHHLRAVFDALDAGDVGTARTHVILATVALNAERAAGRADGAAIDLEALIEQARGVSLEGVAERFDVNWNKGWAAAIAAIRAAAASSETTRGSGHA